MGPETESADRRARAVGAPVRPGSLLWSTAADPRSLLPGLAAGILQLMLPGLGAGVTDHSNFFDDPYDRIDRSIPFIWGSIFAADETEGAARGRQIRDFHPDIKGTDHRGERYHALDPDVFWWAHATFTWEFLRARELFFARPLSRTQRERLYAETVTWYRRYGVSDRVVPPNLRAFRARFDEICRTELELTPAVQWVLDPAANPASQSGPPARLPGPLSVLDPVVAHLGSEFLRLTVFGSMPDVVRRRFGFRWTHADRAAFTAVCASMRGLGPAVARGALSDLWPEGTPHPAPGDATTLVLAGPNLRQRALRARAAAAADSSPELHGPVGGRVGLDVGGQATLVLDANPTTGYSWELTSPPDTAVVRIASDTYVPPAGQVPGAGGTQEIRVEGVAPGSTRLTFGYRRPWETGVPPVETATFDVTVS